MKEDLGERMELAHEPAPGYRTAFYIVLTASSVYLGLLFMMSL